MLHFGPWFALGMYGSTVMKPGSKVPMPPGSCLSCKCHAERGLFCEDLSKKCDLSCNVSLEVDLNFSFEKMISNEYQTCFKESLINSQGKLIRVPGQCCPVCRKYYQTESRTLVLALLDLFYSVICH